MAADAACGKVPPNGGSIVWRRRRTHREPGQVRATQARGREQTTAAILDAAEKLFAERGFTAVTVRDIAAEAGVSHALVHRYLGSKQDVYRAMLVRNEDAIRSAAAEDDELLDGDEPDAAGGADASQRRYVRLIAHSALHGLSYERTSREVRRHRTTRRAGRRPRPPPRATRAIRTRSTRGSSSPASWRCSSAGSAADDWILRAAGLRDASDEEIVDGLERVMLQLLRENFPAAGGDPAAAVTLPPGAG